MRIRTAAPIALFVSGLASALCYPRMPPEVPIHWDLHGHPNGFAPRLLAALLGPALVLGVLAFVYPLRRLDPRARGQGGDAARGREELLAWTVLLCGALGAVVVCASAGVLAEVPRAMALVLAGFLVFGGNVMGTVRPNWFAGIRTPWTLSSDEVWRRTHRLAARCMVAAGLALVPCALALPGPAVIAAMLVLLLASTVGPAMYSYVLWRRLQAG